MRFPVAIVRALSIPVAVNLGRLAKSFAAACVSLLILAAPTYGATGAIAGRVMEPIAPSVSNPVAGANVQCTYRTETEMVRYDATTDANGAYALTDVIEGAHWCTASKAGYVSQAKQVAVAGGRTSHADFEIHQYRSLPPTPLPPLPLCLHPYCPSPIPR